MWSNNEGAIMKVSWTVWSISYQSHLIGLSIVITTSKYVHVSIQGAAAGPRHRGRDFPCHVEHLPSKKVKRNVDKLLTWHILQWQSSRTLKASAQINVTWLESHFREIRTECVKKKFFFKWDNMHIILCFDHKHFWNVFNILTIHLVLSHIPRFHHWVGKLHHQQLTVKNTTCLLLWNKYV